MKKSIVAVALAFLLTTSLCAQDMSVDLGQNGPALHMPFGDTMVKVEPAFEDYAFMVTDVCDAMSLTTEECLIYPMNGTLGGNAIATVLDGNRIIVYDRELSKIVGGDGAEMIIAHEVAHHFCGHIGTVAVPQQELDADRFAGSAMRRMGRSLPSALSAIPIFDRRPSMSHPDKATRIKAITEGWNNPGSGKSCRS